MFPLSDDAPIRTTPYVNYAIIVANVVVFFFEWRMGDTRLNAFFIQHAVIPSHFFNSGIPAMQCIRAWTFKDNIVPVFYSMFLHGGWLHLGGNMLYLFIFGDNVEDRVGHAKYLLFYVLVGFAGTLLHAYLNSDSDMPMIGASGAIAGVLGGYIMMYPRARVKTLVFIIFFVQVLSLPATVVLGLWFISQLFSGVMSLGASAAQSGGTAWWAHVGGFTAGAALIWVFKKNHYFENDENIQWQHETGN